MPGDTDQFLTALMLIGPYVAGGLRITITTPLVSRPVRADHQGRDGRIQHDQVTVGDTEIEIGAGRYVAREYTIEPDGSSASYPLAAAAIAGGRVEILGLMEGSMQGDSAFCDVLGSMGCTSLRTARSTSVERGDVLHGIDIDMVDLSDLVPTLAVVALFADSPTRIRGVGFIREGE